MTSVLCTGELLIDFIGENAHEKMSGQSSFLMKAGGAPANVAAVISALGGECSFFGAVGEDGFGDFLKQTLEAFRVNTLNLKRSKKATTLAFVSVDAKGDRDFVFVRGADADLRLSDLDEDYYENCGLLHFGAATSFLEGDLKKTYNELLMRAKRDHKCVVFDPNYRSAFWAHDLEGFKAEVLPFLRVADLVKLSDEEALIVTGEYELNTAVDALKEQFDAVFAITLGAAGVRLFCKTYDVIVSAPEVVVKDTTGAGDAFIGALIFELSRTENPKESLYDLEVMKHFAKGANAIAAQVCTEYGALTALQSLVADVQLK